MSSVQKQQGQSTVEFVLIASILFFIFFGILQFFYTAFVSFAIQRATYSIAQQAAASANPSSFNPQFQIIEALLPIEQLNPSTLAYTFSTQCIINTDGTNVHVKVSYPMPLWVPLIKNLLGQNLNNQLSVSNSIPSSLTNVLQAVGLSIPNFNINQNLTKVLWITFEAQTLDENSTRADTT
jgi:Flp pilus assembly protein TadG